MGDSKKLLKAVEKASEDVSKWPESKRAAFEHTTGLKLTAPKADNPPKKKSEVK